MGGVVRSKELAALLNDSTDNFPASSDTYRRRSDSPQELSVSRVYSCFVLVSNFVDECQTCRSKARPRGKWADENGGENGRGEMGERENARQPVSRVLSVP
jgi:hypothetical protein